MVIQTARKKSRQIADLVKEYDRLGTTMRAIDIAEVIAKGGWGNLPELYIRFKNRKKEILIELEKHLK